MPYKVCLVPFTEGPLLGSNVAGSDADAKLGAPVRVAFDAVTDDITPPEFTLGREVTRMLVFDLSAEQVFDPRRHVEKVLGRIGEGDVTIACWEPGQVSPNHLHPNATEIYFCHQGGGVMRTPTQTVVVRPGCFVVHPRGELHEYANGPQRTVLFRVRYGEDMSTRIKEWPNNPAFEAKAEDAAWFAMQGKQAGS